MNKPLAGASRPPAGNAGGRHEPYSLLKARQSNKGKVNMGLRYTASAGRAQTDPDRHPPLGARPPHSLMILPQVPQIFASSVRTGGRSYLNHRSGRYRLICELGCRRATSCWWYPPKRGTARHRLTASPSPGGATMAKLFIVAGLGLR